MSQKKMTMGVIVGNRGFFPDQLAKSGREEIIQALSRVGIDSVVLGPEESKHGAVETHDEAKRCAALFRKNSDRIDGVIVTLPILAMSAQSPTPCTWRAWMYRCWCRPPRTTRQR